MTSIGKYAFYNCTSLTSVIIGSGVTSIGESAFYNCTALTEIFIPANVTTINRGAFYNCTCIIFAEAESQPSGWNSSWNSSNCTVFWGFLAIPTKEVTYTFVTNGGSEVESISAVYLVSLPATCKDGYAFVGWYADEDFTTKVTAPYYSSTNITLYAKWYDLNGGTQSEGLEIEDGIIVGIGTCTDTVLYICMPISDRAFNGCTQITTVYLFDGCTSVGYQAFYSCTNLTTIYFYQTEMPELGSDIFGNTWDSSDFAIYVLSSLNSEYQSVSDTYWQSSIVSAGKLYTIE